MNKYLKGFINTIIMLVIGIIGVLFTLNLWFLGMLFVDEVVAKVVGVLDANVNPIWLARNIFPGLIPFFYVLVVTIFLIYGLFKTITLMQKVDIERIILVGFKRKPKQLETMQKTLKSALEESEDKVNE